eukprot:15135-Heterococcus_DN1.PRE.2
MQHARVSHQAPLQQFTERKQTGGSRSTKLWQFSNLKLARRVHNLAEGPDAVFQGLWRRVLPECASAAEAQACTPPSQLHRASEIFPCDT